MAGVKGVVTMHNYEELLSKYSMSDFADNPPIVAYQEFEDDRVVQIQIVGQTGKTPLILLNVKLLADKHYIDRVKDLLRRRCGSDILAELSRLSMDITSAIVLYLGAAVEYGHCDPKAGGYIRIEDWETYAGERMWIKVYADIEERLPTRQHVEVAKNEQKQ